MLKVKRIILETCVTPGMILALESPPLLFKLFTLVSLTFFLLVLVDKKVMFHNVLFIERNLRYGKYSRYVCVLSTNSEAFLQMLLLLHLKTEVKIML